MRKLLFLLLLVPSLAYAQPVLMQGFENNEDLTATGVEMGTSAGTKSIVTSPVHGGTYAARCNPTTTGTCNIVLRAFAGAGVPSSTNPNTTDCYSLFAFYAATLPASASEEIGNLRDTGSAATKMYLRITSTGTLQLYDKDNAAIAASLTTTALSTNTWYWIAVRGANGTSGAWGLTVYNDTPASAALETLTGTANQLATNCGPWNMGKANNRNGNTVDFYYDDFVMMTSGAPLRGKINMMLPEASGTNSQWTSGPGPTFAEVDEIQTDTDTTYLKNSASVNQTHDLNLVSSATAGIGASNTINYVMCGAFAREDTSVTSAFQAGCLSGATASLHSAQNMSTTYLAQEKFTSLDPADAGAWTIADLDALQVRVFEANAVQDRVTKMFAMVQSQAPASTFIRSRRLDR